jgi:hypothetical protein
MELCDLLGVPRPEPARADMRDNTYVFERAVLFQHGDGTSSTGFIDLYRRACFVLETKQGVEAEEAAQPLSDEEKARRSARRKGHGVRGSGGWDTALKKARAQAERYARALPEDEGRPPFVVVVDVGYCIELYSEFSRSGSTYVPFPDPRSHRLLLQDLRKPEVRDILSQVWTDPMSLDPSRRSAAVTRDIAAKLAQLAKSLESDGHSAKGVPEFLMRCLFTMFAEDVGLLPQDTFKNLLKDVLPKPDAFKPAVEDLWRIMNTGGFYSRLMTDLLRFNGGLFATPHALPLTRDQVQLLSEAAAQNWREVEPAIFGTLLERALDPRERHKLGAHYTPRAYVERLVLPTLVEPLRDEWEAVQTAATLLMAQAEEKEAQAAKEKEHAAVKGAKVADHSRAMKKLQTDARKLHADAMKQVMAFHRQLCQTRVLDPACGSGNFLYVALEHLKRIEGEVLEFAAQLAGGQEEIESEGLTVDPHQLLGIELNPRAAAIAELVLWIGYLQWHYRTRGSVNPPIPVIKNFGNIQCRDAVLAYDSTRIVIDPATNAPVTHWDGYTTKPHPVTGQEVPDESARIPVYEYINPRPAVWPEAEYVIGNPPFIGNKRMRLALGDGYVETLRSLSDVPSTADFVMYWWHQAAKLVAKKAVQRFGFITTNSITQTFNRCVLDEFLTPDSPLSLTYAIPDHPWVDSSDGAAVRIAMTVAADSGGESRIDIAEELPASPDGVPGVKLFPKAGKINSNLSVGVDVSIAQQLSANQGLCGQGVIVLGDGFLLNEEECQTLCEVEPEIRPRIKAYMNGKDLLYTSRGLRILDLYGLGEKELRASYPHTYQRIYDLVRPGRLQMKDKARREKWWLFGRSNQELRGAIGGLEWFIATCRTAKHRTFIRVPGDLLPDAKIVAIGLQSYLHLGILSSRIHVLWAKRTGAWLGVGNDSNYNHADCFNKFPFPDATPAQEARIRELGERLDAHRKARQAEHPSLTITGMYNVLEKLRKGEALTAKEKEIHEQGLVSVLKEIHDELDAAVFDAYGWPGDLSDEEILERLVALNAERAAEERQGKVRWLRPEYQCPGGAAVQLETESEVSGESAPATPTAKVPWPKTMPDRARAVRAALAVRNTPATADEVALAFSNAKRAGVLELLETLAALGQCRRVDSDRYAA